MATQATGFLNPNVKLSKGLQLLDDIAVLKMSS